MVLKEKAIKLEINTGETRTNANILITVDCADF